MPGDIQLNPATATYKDYIDALGKINKTHSEAKIIKQLAYIVCAASEAKTNKKLTKQMAEEIAKEINNFLSPLTIKICETIIEKNLGIFESATNETKYFESAENIYYTLQLASNILFLLPIHNLENPATGERQFKNQLIGNLLIKNKISYNLLFNAYNYNNDLSRNDTNQTSIEHRFSQLIDDILTYKELKTTNPTKDECDDLDKKIFKNTKKDNTLTAYVKYVKNKIDETEENSVNLTSVNKGKEKTVSFELTYYNDAKHCSINGGDTKKNIDILFQVAKLMNVQLPPLGDSNSTDFLTMLPEKVTLEDFANEVQKAITAPLKTSAVSAIFSSNFITTTHAENDTLPSTLAEKIPGALEKIYSAPPSPKQA